MRMRSMYLLPGSSHMCTCWLGATDSTSPPPAVLQVVAPPELHHCYSEQLALMPHCYFVNDYKAAHQEVLDPANLPKRTEFGLPDDKIVYSCSNQLYKVRRGSRACGTELRGLAGSGLPRSLGHARSC